MQIDDFFDAQYEAAIETSAYHKAKYGYLDGEYVEPLPQGKGKPRGITGPLSDEQSYKRSGVVPFDHDSLGAAIVDAGHTSFTLCKTLGYHRLYIYASLRSGRISKDRLDVICSLLELDASRLVRRFAPSTS